MTATSTRNEDLKVGDVVTEWFGECRIIAIEPYEGPLKDIIFAVARTAPKRDFSLERGGYTLIID